MNAKIYCLFTLVVGLGACSKPQQDPSALEKAQRIWVPREVRENNVLVYQRDNTTNIKPGYQSFRLDLGANGRLALTDVQSSSQTDPFAGNWALQTPETPTKLILSNLTPVPSETGERIEYRITSLTVAELRLTRLTASPKTGNTTNDYVLIPQP